jgi:hypothetical protein
MKPWLRCSLLLIGAVILYGSYLLGAPLNGKDDLTLDEACRLFICMEVVSVGLLAVVAAFVAGDYS